MGTHCGVPAINSANIVREEREGGLSYVQQLRAKSGVGQQVIYLCLK